MNRSDIIRRLRALPFAPHAYWLITGGAMVLYGLREETSDIDLGCSRELAGELERQGCQTERLDDGTRRIVLAPDIELFEDWLYDRVEMVENVPVISLEGLLAMKQALGREKDLADIQRIRTFLHARRPPDF